MIAFLTIASGDSVTQSSLKQRYDITLSYLAKVASTYSLPTDTTALSADDKELLVSTAPGTELVFDPPPPLVAGTLYIALPDTLGLKKTRENFIALCTGAKGNAKSDRNKKLHYKGTPLHRVEKGFVVQGGDLTRRDGSGGESIYGGTFKAEAEGLAKPPIYGSVCMANSGRKDSITSQFFLVTATEPERLAKLAGKQYVNFGQLILDPSQIHSIPAISLTQAIASTKAALQRLESLATPNGNPTDKVWIQDCGVL